DRLEEERSRDPIPSLKQYLVPALFSEDDWNALVDSVQQEVRQAADAAIALPLPDPSQITRYAFSDSAAPQKVGGLVAEDITPPAGSDAPNPSVPSRIGMVEAIRRTLDYELSINDRVLIFG